MEWDTYNNYTGNFLIGWYKLVITGIGIAEDDKFHDILLTWSSKSDNKNTILENIIFDPSKHIMDYPNFLDDSTSQERIYAYMN